MNIYQLLVEAGFCITKPSDVTIDLEPSLSLSIASEKDLSHYRITVRDTSGEDGLLTTAHLSRFDSVDETNKPHYAMHTHDDLSLYLEHITVDAAKQKLEKVNVARQATFSLLVTLKEMEPELINACTVARKAIKVQEDEQEKIQERNRLERIEAYKKGKSKRGEEAAQNIMSTMASNVEATGITETKSFEILMASGRAKTKTFSAVWEKGRLSWKSSLNHLVEPEVVLNTIANSWVEDV